MKQNDWFALNLNIEERGIVPEANLALYGITADNTGLQDKDYYKNIPRVIDHFTGDSGEFNEEAFNAYYDSLSRSYSDFANDSFIKNLVSSVSDSPYDIFSMNSMNWADDSARIRITRDPNRHQVGMGNLFKRGEAVFSEREVAQENKARDAEGNIHDWSPNDKGFLKGLFRPTLAMAVWDENGTHIENGQVVHHFKGQHKYDPETGDPFYQELKEGEELYGRDILHFTDTLSREGTVWNKIDVFDSDGVKGNLAKVIGRVALEAGLYMSPAGWVLGGLEAAIALGKTLPVITKQINGMITGDNSNSLGRTMTSVENWMARFDRSESDESQGKFWGYENIGNMVIDSITQLYSQGLIQKLPKLLSANPSIFTQRLGQTASIAYMATTSAEDVYGQYKLAGADDRTAGIASLATMAAFFAFMNNDYFKTNLFGIPGMELPELHKLVGTELKTTNAAIINQINKNATGKAAEIGKKVLINPIAGDKWYTKVFNAATGVINKVAPKIVDVATQNPYMVRGLNEGLEEVMEEASTDLIKGITLGADTLGIKVRQDENKELDFGFTPEDFFSRYIASAVGGFLGGTVFEGLTQWNNRKVKSISKLPVDEQLAWYIRNGYSDEIEKIIEYREKRGKNGSTALSFDYTVDETDPEHKKIVFKSGDEHNNQNKEVSDNLRQRVKLLRVELEALNILHSDNEVLTKAMDEIKSEAKKAGITVSDYQNKNLRDARIDFIKQTGIDRLIIADAANLRHIILRYSRLIDDRIKELSEGVQDNQRDKLQAEIDSDETIKLWRSELKRFKDDYQELLNGKHVNHYLSLALFRNDDDLYKTYVADIAKDEKKRYFEDIKGYVRARYNRDYDEWIRNSGEAGEDGKTALQRYLEDEFNEWVASINSTQKLLGAFSIHQRISELLRPVIEEQIKNYNSYKSEAERAKSISGSIEGRSYLDKLTRELDAANNALAKYREEHSENPENDEEYKKLEEAYRRAFLAYNVFSGMVWKDGEDGNTTAQSTSGRGLDVMFKPDAQTKIDFINTLLDKGNKELFEFISNYYKHLNDDKIVSDFAEDLLEIGVSQAAQRNHDISITDLNTRRGIVVANTYNQDDPVNIETKLIEELDSDSSISEEDRNKILGEFNALKDAYDESGRAAKFEYNGIVASFAGHASRILNDLEFQIEDVDLMAYSESEREKNNPLYLDQDTFTIFRDKIENFYNQMLKTPELGISAYNDLVNWLTEYAKTHAVEGDPKAIIDSILFGDGVNFVDKIQQIKQIRAQGIPTPVRDLINALSTEFNGVKLPLWDILQEQILGLKSLDDAEDYVIKSPSAYSELQFLMHALQVVSANIKAAVPFGVNTYLAMLDEGNVYPILGSQTLGDVYETDLNILFQRVGHLLDLHERNKRSTIELKRESKIVNAPKFARAIIVNLPGQKKPLHENFERIGIDISKIWEEANTENIDLENDTITEENFDNFWYAFRRFMDGLYNAVDNVNWEKALETLNEGRGDDTKLTSKNEAIAFLLTNSFTDLWKLETSEINNRPESEITSYDTVQFLKAILSTNPKQIFESIQATSEKLNRALFWDQEIAVFEAAAQGYNQDLANTIMLAINAAKYGAIVNNKDIDDESVEYLKEKPIILNATNVDGASGTGKSSTVLRFVSEIFKLNPPEGDAGNKVVRELVVSKYTRRMNALGDALNVTGDNRSIVSELQKKLLGRELTEDDFESKSGHWHRLKKTDDGNSYLITEELAKRKNIWGLNDNEVLNVYIDESSLLNEADLVFLSEASKFGAVNLYFAGDMMQRGYTMLNEDGKQVSSGLVDVMIWNSARLTQSLRSSYYGMQVNLERFESLIGTLLSAVRETPWMYSSTLTSKYSGLAADIKLKYAETDDGIYGFNVVSNGDAAFDKLKQYGGTIGIITNDTEKYKHLSSSDVIVLTPEEAQGEEVDYVLIDVAPDSLPTQLLDYLQSAYTMISRARKGGYIINGIGNRITSAVIEPTASVEINERGEDQELAGEEIENYKTWFKTLYKNDIYNGTPAQTTSEEASSSESDEDDEEDPAGKSGSPGNGSAYKPAFADTFVEEGWNDEAEEHWKEEAREKGSNIVSPYATRTEQKSHDFENYRKRHQFLTEHHYTGDAMDPKAFIDWLITPEAKAIFEGKFSPIYNFSYNDAQYKAFLEFIRNFSLFFWQESGEDLVQAVTKNKQSQYDIFGNNANWRQIIDALHAQIKNDSGQRLVYAVKEGTDVYLYYRVNTGVKNIAIPVGIVPNGKFEGWYNLSVSQAVPMTMLTSDGQTTKDISEISGNGTLNYVEVSDDMYLIKADDDEMEFSDTEAGRDCKTHVRGMRGIGQVIVSSEFGHTEKDNQELLSPRPGQDGKTERIDHTELDGNRRFMAINRRITAKEYFEIAQILNKLRHKGRHSAGSVNDIEYKKLLYYWDEGILNGISSAEDEGDKIKAIKKAYLISNSSRAKLVSALMRYYIKDVKAGRGTFNSEFNKYIADTPSSYKRFTYQKGTSLTIYKQNGFPETFYIMFNQDANNFEVYGWDNVERKYVSILSIETTDWLTSGNQDPYRAAFKLLNVLSTNRLISGTFSEEDVAKFLQTGDISISLTSKRIDPDGNITFYPPFDSDIAELVDLSSISDDLDNFLRHDTVFKYGFLVSPNASGNFNDNWFVTHDRRQYRTDMLEILPPVFQIEFGSIGSTDGLPNLGTLDHKISSDDPTNITVERKLDEYGNVLGYTLQKNYKITTNDLGKFIDVTNIKSSTVFVTNIGYDNGWFVEFTDDSGQGYRREIKESDISVLLSGMRVLDTAPDVILRSGDYFIVPSDTGYTIKHGSYFDDGIILSFKDGQLKVFAHGEIITFDNATEEQVKESGWTRFDSPEFVFTGVSNDGFNNRLIYYNNSSKRIRIVTLTDITPDIVEGKIMSVSTLDDSSLEVSIQTSKGDDVLTINSSETDLYNLFKDQSFVPAPVVFSPGESLQLQEVFGKKITPQMKADALLKTDPNAWARKYATELGGLYAYDAKKGRFVYPKTNKRTFAFINWIASNFGYDNSIVQTIIDEMEDVSFDDTTGFITLTWSGQTFKAAVENKNAGFVFTEYNPEVETNLQKLTTLLDGIQDESLRNALLTIIKARIDSSVNDADAWDTIGRISDPASKAIIGQVIELMNDLDEEEICRIN